MSTKFKIDDVVKVLRRGSAGKHMEGAEGRVVKVADGWVYVEDRTGGGLLNYGGTKSWMFTEENVELVEEALADWEKELLGIETKQFKEGDRVKVVKGTYACTEEHLGKEGTVTYVTGDQVTVEVEGDYSYIHRPEGLKLIETKQEPEVKQTFKAGDKVRVINGSRWHKQGESGKITAVDRWDNLELNGWWLSPQNVELVTEKPKARSQEIKLEDVQVGDTVVAFWNLNGVEYRQKGTVAEINSDGEPITDERNFVVHTGGASRAFSFGTPAEHIYLLERPEVKEPEIADGTYWVTEKDVNDRIWWKVEVKDSKATWGIRGDMSDVALVGYDYLVEVPKSNYHTLHTTNPFPEPTGFDALDKTVKYFLKSEDSYSDYVLAYEGGRWTYGWVGSDIRVGAANYEVAFTEGNRDWAKPVPYEPTDLEKLSEAGLVGHKFQDWTTYKVTKKGNINYKNPHDKWVKSSHNADSFIADVANGVMVKIS